MDKENILYGSLLVGFGILVGWVVKGIMDDRKAAAAKPSDIVSQLLAANAARLGAVPWATPPVRDPNYRVGVRMSGAGGLVLGDNPEENTEGKLARGILTYL